MHLVSIIVPIFNSQLYLEKCILSILSQTYSNIEIILINDGSIDDSEKICIKLLQNDARVQYYYKKNGGLSSARNFGLEIARGEYISFIDSDDFVESTFIEKLVSACVRNNAKISVCSRKNIFGHKITYQFYNDREFKIFSKDAIMYILQWKKLDSSVCDKIFHRSLFQNTRFALNRISEDLPILFYFLTKIDFLIHIGEPLYIYFHRENNSITKQGFSIKKMSILDSANEVKEMVDSKYPDLSTLSHSFYLHHVIYIYKLLAQANKNDQFDVEHQYINNIINKNFLKILLNKHLKLINKIIATLIFIKMYSFIKHVQKKVLNEKK